MSTTVLIVDDSPTFREYIRSGLESAGYQVISAESGEQGLALAQSSAIHAVIVDNVLPGIDGASVVRRLRQQVRHRRTPSLLLTASDDPAQELHALEAGADAFVRKDESIEVLLARLASVLRSVGSPAAADADASPRRPPEILFVNTQGTLADECARVLTGEGVTVAGMPEAEVSSGAWDCIVANVGEVSRSGPLVRQLRGMRSACPARLILLGTSDSRSELVEAIALGADDYLPLSAGEAVLTARVRAQLRRKQLEDENEQARQGLLRHNLELEAQRQMAAARSAVAEELRIARDLAEEKAREFENLLAQNEAVFRSISEGLIIADLDGAFLQVNESALAIFQSPDPRALQRLWQAGENVCEVRTLAGEPVPSAEWPLSRAQRGESVTALELKFLRRDTGWSFIGSFSAVPVNDRRGSRILAALTIRDITAQKRSEDVLRRTEQLAVTGRLAASIAHELNNPLSAVMNLLFLLNPAVENNPEAAEYLAMAQKELRRVAEITRQTLAFYRESTQPVEVDMRELATEVADLFAARLRTAELHLRTDIECHTRPRAFAGEIRQVMSNLIANAIDASSPGGEIRMRIRSVTGKEGARVCITIADQGSGIPRTFYGEMFKPFASLKGSRGTGLGLWVTQSIVARHGGQIRFRSRTTRRPTGTIFTVFIPLAPAHKPAHPDTISALFRELGNELLGRPAGAGARTAEHDT